jgi:predicted DNA binding CopG/RHH family protein
VKKPIPVFETDEEAEAFIATANLSNYDLSGGQIVRFELKPKGQAVSLRLPKQLLEAVRERAKSAGMPHQRFIRLALEKALLDTSK